jgi:hypothetical protein
LAANHEAAPGALLEGSLHGQLEIEDEHVEALRA